MTGLDRIVVYESFIYVQYLFICNSPLRFCILLIFSSETTNQQSHMKTSTVFWNYSTFKYTINCHSKVATNKGLYYDLARFNAITIQFVYSK